MFHRIYLYQSTPPGNSKAIIADTMVLFRSLHPEIHILLAERMELPDLLQWRAVCMKTYHVADGVLRRAVQTILRPFFANPSVFLHLLTRYRGIVGGVAALSLILQDPTIRCSVLQLYVGSYLYQSFVAALLTCPFNSGTIQTVTYHTVPRRLSADRDVATLATISLKNGRCILVYRSGSVSPCSTLCRSPCTALMNFFTEHTFGSAYPALTSRRRALITTMRNPFAFDPDFVILASILAAGFTLGHSPASWSDYKRVGQVRSPLDNPCYRHMYICPQQSRSFGDSGSLTGFLHPLRPEPERVRGYMLPPFGAMVTWRLMSLYECAYSCDAADADLHEWLISAPQLSIPNPFDITPTRVRPRCTVPCTHHIICTANGRRSRSLSI